MLLSNLIQLLGQVDDVSVTTDEINEQVDALRARFGTLHLVERAVAKGDFINIDLVAKVNGEEVEGGTANDISYDDVFVYQLRTMARPGEAKMSPIKRRLVKGTDF